MQIKSHLNLIFHINPSESNYEESLSTLQFSERTKNFQAQNNNFMEKNNDPTQRNQNQEIIQPPYISSTDKKIIEQQKEEITELKNQINANNMEHQEKLIKLQELLGLNYDLDKLLTKSNQKDFIFKEQRELKQKSENLEKIKLDMDQKIKRLLKVIEDQKRDSQMSLEKQQCTVLELREANKKLKDQVNQLKISNERNLIEAKNFHSNEIKNIIEKSSELLDEKSQKLMNLPVEQEKKTKQNIDFIRDMDKARQEIDEEWHTKVQKIEEQYKMLLANTKSQYEFFLKQKNDEMDTYVQQLKKYREKKKNQTNEYKTELVDLFEIVQKFNKIVQRVESGQFSGGLKSFNIPSKEKPDMPTRMKYKNLFKLVDQKHINVTQPIEQKKSVKNLETQLSTQNDQIKQKTLQDFQKIGGLSPRNLYISPEDLVDLNLDLNRIFKGKEEFETLKVYTERIKDSLEAAFLREKEIKYRIDQYEQMNKNIDIQTLLKDKEEYKQKYLNEIKLHNQTMAAMESQKRLLSAKFTQNSGHTSAVAQIRPQTASDRRIKTGNLPTLNK